MSKTGLTSYVGILVAITLLAMPCCSRQSLAGVHCSSSKDAPQDDSRKGQTWNGGRCGR